MTSPLIVAIDGPSGVGKSTTSKLVAGELHLPHIDTGAMYRAIAFAAKRDGIPLSDPDALEQLAARSTIEFGAESPHHVFLDGADITDLIRTPEMSMAASNVSAVPQVRRVLVRLQQQMGRAHGGVLEGRDIGTVVFPETPHKFFLTARPEVRARRRYEQLLAKGTAADLEDVLAETTLRDRQDSTRKDSPLSVNESYQVIDTSDLTIPEVVRLIVKAVRKRA
ncbi:MAG: (d)CMP kinase [Thermoanaerobaculia bacterium]